MLGPLKPFFFPVLAAALFAYVVFTFIRPGEKFERPEAKDVAANWSETVSQLGILPVFPPQEDFHVGDIWAVIYSDGRSNSDAAMLNRGLRIGHLDLRSEIIGSARAMPVFAETVELDAKRKFRPQPRAEIAADSQNVDKITLSLTAFPGITLSHTDRSSASLGLRNVGSGASRDDQDFEEIRVPVAETYGVSAEDAYVKFLAWCRVPENAPRCGERYIRNLLAFVIDPNVLKKTDNRYDVAVQIQIVSRVFLTRELEHRRRVSAARGGSLKVSADGTAVSTSLPAPGAVATETGVAAQAATAANAVSQVNDAAQAGKTAAAGGAIVQADGVEVQLREVFQRPVAFGYRAVTLLPKP